MMLFNVKTIRPKPLRTLTALSWFFLISTSYAQELGKAQEVIQQILPPSLKKEKEFIETAKATKIHPDFLVVPSLPKVVEEKPKEEVVVIHHVTDPVLEPPPQPLPPPAPPVNHDENAGSELLAQQSRRRLAQRRARQERFREKESPVVTDIYNRDPHYRIWDQRVGEEKLTYPVDRDWVMTKENHISGILETEVSSAIGGTVQVLVDTDHFASKGWKVILPKGTRLICQYQPLSNVSDTKLPLRCTEAIRPDGARLLFDSQGKDSMGREGMIGNIDHRTLEKYGSAFTMSALATLADASSARLSSKNPYLQNGSTQLSQNLGHVTAELIDQNLELAPVITIEAGSQVCIQPTTDIWMRPPLSRQEIEAMRRESAQQQQRQASQSQNQAFSSQQQGEF